MVKLLLFQHQYFNMILKLSNIIIADHVIMTTIIIENVINIVISMSDHVIMAMIIMDSVIAIVISMSDNVIMTTIIMKV